MTFRIIHARVVKRGGSWRVVDNTTGQTLSTHKTKLEAQAEADRRNNG